MLKNIKGIRGMIALSMGAIALILVVITIFTLSLSVYTRQEYESLLKESVNKYTLVNQMETSATNIKYRKALKYDVGFEQLKLIMLIKEYSETYSEIGSEDAQLMTDLIKTFQEDGMDTTLIITTMQDMKDIVSANLNEKDLQLQGEMDKLIFISVIAVIAAVIIVIALCYIFPKKLAMPIKKITACAKSVAAGEFENVNFPRTSIPELEELNESFQSLSSAVSEIVNSVDYVCYEFENGNYKKINLDNTKLKGGYYQVACKINRLLDNTESIIREILGCVNAFVKGDFNYQLRTYAGEHAVINQELSMCQERFKEIIVNINALSDAVRVGKLKTRLDSDGVTGDWLEVVNGLNGLVEAIEMPITVTIEGLNKLAAAELSYRIDNAFEGDYKKIADTINYVAETLENYVSDINNVFRALADNDLTVESKIEYKGDFAEIGISFERVINNLRGLLGSMISASEQIEMGSKSMAQSSTSLAVGATQQADAVRILLDLSQNVTEKSVENHTAVTSAKKYSDNVSEDIKNGNQLLIELNKAINNIATASNAINNINEVIDDIAFQTNILALNAAIEAARAGQHGKGFAVVADEVRNLAGKSQTSAKNAGDLIQETLNRVEEGVKVVNNTTSLLTNILSETTKIDTIINNVLSISGEQKDLSERMQVETVKINDVVNNISAISEETAATSEELASQIETFNTNINMFKIS